MSPREVQQPTAEYRDGPGADKQTIMRHPAYGQIEVNRSSASGGGARLYGSDTEHQHFMTISIHESELHRMLANDWPMSRREIIEVGMTEAQWATFVSSPNSGRGVQCTVIQREGKPLPDLPPPADRTEQFRGELTDRFERTRATIAQLRQRLVDRKTDRETLALVDRIVMEIDKNFPFVADQFGEHMERQVERAKIEVHAHMQAALQHPGLAALATSKDAPSSLPHPHEEEKS